MVLRDDVIDNIKATESQRMERALPELSPASDQPYDNKANDRSCSWNCFSDPKACSNNLEDLFGGGEKKENTFLEGEFEEVHFDATTESNREMRKIPARKLRANLSLVDDWNTLPHALHDETPGPPNPDYFVSPQTTPPPSSSGDGLGDESQDSMPNLVVAESTRKKSQDVTKLDGGMIYEEFQGGVHQGEVE